MVVFCETAHSALHIFTGSEFYSSVTTIFFSLIVMSLSANLLSLTWPIYFKFSQLSLGIALLSKSTVAVMYDRTNGVLA
jgi:hypothetical protein